MREWLLRWESQTTRPAVDVFDEWHHAELLDVSVRLATESTMTASIWPEKNLSAVAAGVTWSVARFEAVTLLKIEAET